MIIHGIDSKDYIYLRLLVESKHYPFRYSHLKKDSIIRFKIEGLRKNLWRRGVFEHLDYFAFVENESATNQDYEPSKLYKSAVVTKDINLEISLDAKDILLINEWLWARLNSVETPEVNSNNLLSFLFGTDKSKSPIERNKDRLEHTRVVRYNGKEYVGCDIFDGNNNSTALPQRRMLELPANIGVSNNQQITDAYQFASDASIVVPLKKGDVLDFNDPVINLLFLRQNWMRLLANTQKVSEKKNLELFEKDFSGFVPKAGRRYFKLHSYLNLRSLKEITDSKVFEEIRKRDASFENIFYNDDYRFSHVDNYDLDENGFIRYVWCTDEPIVEHELLKIADRVSYEEAWDHYEHECVMKELLAEQRELEREAAKYIKYHQGKYHKRRRENPDLSPIDFMFQEIEREKEVKKELVRRLTKTLGKIKNS